MAPNPHFHQELDDMTHKDIQPLKDRVVLLPAEHPDKTPGGIILPDVSKQRTVKGTVFAVGEEIKSVAIGDVVHFSEWGGQRFEVDGHTYLIFKEEELLCKEVKS